MVYVKVLLNTLSIGITSVLSLLSVSIICIYLCSMACDGMSGITVVDSSGYNSFLIYAN